MPVQEMLGRMSSMEVTEWKAFFIEKRERQKPRQQSATEAKALLGALSKSKVRFGRGNKQPTRKR